MAPSFEDLANSGIPVDAPTSHKSSRSKPLIILLLAIALGTLGTLAYFHDSSEPDLPTAAKILLTVNADLPDVLPHTLDSSTEFDESFDYLKEGAKAPDYRETEEGRVKQASVLPMEQTIASTTNVSSRNTDDEPAAAVHADAIDTNPQAPIELAFKATATPEKAPIVAKQEPIMLQQESTATTSVEFDIGSTRDWGGIVLVPDNSKLAKAYTSTVRLSRVEAHPIDGDRIRVWARIQNLTHSPISPEVGCEFRSSQNGEYSNANFQPSIIQQEGIIDVYFVSPNNRVDSYTVMVKQ